MAIVPEALYLQLGQHVAEMPDVLTVDARGNVPVDVLRWLGRAANLIEMVYASDLGNSDPLYFRLACNGLGGPIVLRSGNAHDISAIVFRALAKAEANAPAGARGSFVPAGAGFSALQSVGKVLQEAATDVLIVDPYLDATALTDFAPLVAENVALRLLGDSATTKPDSLRPATQRWVAQHAAARPLEIRLSAPRALHDRLILIDRQIVWVLTQSLKDFAKRSPASVNRADPEVGQLKIAHYDGACHSATRL